MVMTFMECGGTWNLERRTWDSVLENAVLWNGQNLERQNLNAVLGSWDDACAGVWWVVCCVLA